MAIHVENSSANTSGSLWAGAAQVDITPPLGTLINGDFVTHYARHVHDKLYAKALVLQNGSSVVAIAIVDICVMDKELLDAVKAEIDAQTGIHATHTLIASTHTHAAGAVANLHLGAADLPYRQALPPLIVKAVVQASQNLRPAKIGFGTVDAPEHVLCRRYLMKENFISRNPVTGAAEPVKTNPFGSEHLIDCPAALPDTQVGFLTVRGLDDQWISVLANYSLHYVGDWPDGTVTADYFGVFSAELGRKLSANEDFVGMMSNGTSGDANIWDFQHPHRYPKGHFEKSRLIGSDLAQKVAEAITNITWQTNPSLSVLYHELPVGTRKPTPAEVIAAQKIVAESAYENFNPNGENALSQLFAREQVLLNTYPDTILFPLQVIQIGNAMIGALGGEFFAETGMALKESSSAPHYFTITLANGFVGYVPPAHEMGRGGYEAWRCRTSFLVEDAEDRIRTALTALMRNL